MRKPRSACSTALAGILSTQRSGEERAAAARRLLCSVRVQLQLLPTTTALPRCTSRLRRMPARLRAPCSKLARCPKQPMRGRGLPSILQRHAARNTRMRCSPPEACTHHQSSGRGARSRRCCSRTQSPSCTLQRVGSSSRRSLPHSSASSTASQSVPSVCGRSSRHAVRFVPISSRSWLGARHRTPKSPTCCACTSTSTCVGSRFSARSSRGQALLRLWSLQSARWMRTPKCRRTRSVRRCEVRAQSSKRYAPYAAARARRATPFARCAPLGITRVRAARWVVRARVSVCSPTSPSALRTHCTSTARLCVASPLSTSMCITATAPKPASRTWCPLSSKRCGRAPGARSVCRALTSSRGSAPLTRTTSSSARSTALAPRVSPEPPASSTRARAGLPPAYSRRKYTTRPCHCARQAQCGGGRCCPLCWRRSTLSRQI
mmetsp:Transcript_31049/g.72179  ORF Transcript_31049/g.72179 Transcript_31049/m.72179 type:complete len:435 (+) Transcript_31049:643-1947(+)